MSRYLASKVGGASPAPTLKRFKGHNFLAVGARPKGALAPVLEMCPVSFYFIIWFSSKMGRRTAITMKATIAPMARIITGSTRESALSSLLLKSSS